MAKPLMRLMYHPQARPFIKRNHDTAMSKDDIDMYLGYLECVVPETSLFRPISLKPDTNTSRQRRRQCFCTSTRASSEDDAQTVAECLVTDAHLIGQLLDSFAARTQRSVCMLLERLSSYESTTAAILSLEPCLRLVELLGDGDAMIRKFALKTLANIIRSGCAQAVLDAGVLDHVGKLLHDFDTGVPESTCVMLGSLASHAPMELLTRLDLEVCNQLVKLSRSRHVLSRVRIRHTCEDLRAIGRLLILSASNDTEVFSDTVAALLAISRWPPDGTKAVSKAGGLMHFPRLLRFTDTYTRASPCAILGYFARHELLPLTGLAWELPGQLVSVLSDSDIYVRRCSIEALYNISQGVAGARAIMKTKVLHHIPTLLGYGDEGTETMTCVLLAQLASNTHLALGS
ncbi:armadillo-type protein [Mycena polygramma]|nr:armadillo-type protein [Mycena polygramma]